MSFQNSHKEVDVDEMDDDTYTIKTIQPAEFELCKKNGARTKSTQQVQSMDIDDDGSDGIECPLCGKLIQLSLEAHFETVHKEYECIFCGILFDSEAIRASHVDEYHPDETNTQRPIETATKRLLLQPPGGEGREIRHLQRDGFPHQ